MRPISEKRSPVYTHFLIPKAYHGCLSKIVVPGHGESHFLKSVLSLTVRSVGQVLIQKHLCLAGGALGSVRAKVVDKYDTISNLEDACIVHRRST